MCLDLCQFVRWVGQANKKEATYFYILRTNVQLKPITDVRLSVHLRLEAFIWRVPVGELMGVLGRCHGLNPAGNYAPCSHSPLPTASRDRETKGRDSQLR